MSYSYADELISDLHKDAYGFRPRGVYMQDWKDMTPGEKQAEWDHLCQLVEAGEQARKLAEGEAYDHWCTHILKLTLEHGVSHAQAVKQDMRARGADSDIGYYCYLLGLSFSVESEISELLERV